MNANAVPLQHFPPLPAPPQPVEDAEDMRLRVVMQNLNVFQMHDVSNYELARAKNMVQAHGTTPLKMLQTIVYLDHPERTKVDGSDRRVALAALLGISIGFEPKSAQSLVDQARNKPLADVASFVAGEMLAVACTAAAGYGAYLVTGKAMAGASAKAAGIKAGTVGVGKGLLCVTGWMGLAFGALVVGAAGIRAGVNKAEEVADDHRDLLEAKYYKDQRIWEGIKQGRITLPNHAPRAAR